MEKVREHTEGRIAKAIENQTAKLPSDIFLWAGLGMLGMSVLLHFAKQKHAALLIGQFASPFLIMGLYDKTVKQDGHDAVDQVAAPAPKQSVAQV